MTQRLLGVLFANFKWGPRETLCVYRRGTVTALTLSSSSSSSSREAAGGCRRQRKNTERAHSNFQLGNHNLTQQG
jgi:hypothetical protein